jgi:hypothetical protein
MDRKINHKINKKSAGHGTNILNFCTRRVRMYLIYTIICAYSEIFDARAEDCERGEQENARKKVSTIEIDTLE